MKVRWLIEKYLFEEYENQLKQLVIDSGNLCTIIDDTNIFFDFNKKIKDKYTEKECIIFYGSLQLGRQIWEKTNLIPGIFLTIDNYECFKYYGYYGNDLINSNYIMLGLNDLNRRKNEIFNYFKSDKIFIRPSNGYKSFPGQLLSLKNWDEDLHLLFSSYSGLDMDQLILISNYQKIIEENRFVVINKNDGNHIIGGCKYSINGELIKDYQYDKNSYLNAHKFINNYTPDKAFTIDIAKMDNGEYKILEIGSFCCAGLYNIKLENIVKEINELCIYEFNDFYSI
jgi:hypothetical protein